jgi:putative PIN family toxin of toxin-antitoxin system
MKVVLDTNIYVSAFGFGGKPAEIIKLGLADKFKIIISDLIIEETIDICVRKIGLNKEDVSYLMDEIVYFSEFIRPCSKLGVSRNRGDNIVLATALDGKADYLVTGDKKHLLVIKQFERVEILDANNFYKKFL